MFEVIVKNVVLSLMIYFGIQRLVPNLALDDVDAIAIDGIFKMLHSLQQ